MPQDSGIGMEPEELTRIFEVFAQVDQSLERSRGGLGLGLSVAKGLVELHGGSIVAGSAGIGRGAEFMIELPLQAELPALTGTPVVSRAAPSRRVLVVEDNYDAAESLRMHLTKPVDPERLLEQLAAA